MLCPAARSSAKRAAAGAARSVARANIISHYNTVQVCVDVYFWCRRLSTSPLKQGSARTQALETPVEPKPPAPAKNIGNAQQWTQSEVHCTRPCRRACETLLKASGALAALRTAGGVFEILHLNHLRVDNFLEDELRDSVTPLDCGARGRCRGLRGKARRCDRRVGVKTHFGSRRRSG